MNEDMRIYKDFDEWLNDNFSWKDEAYNYRIVWDEGFKTGQAQLIDKLKEMDSTTLSVLKDREKIYELEKKLEIAIEALTEISIPHDKINDLDIIASEALDKIK